MLLEAFEAVGLPPPPSLALCEAPECEAPACKESARVVPPCELPAFEPERCFLEEPLTIAFARSPAPCISSLPIMPNNEPFREPVDSDFVIAPKLTLLVVPFDPPLPEVLMLDTRGRSLPECFPPPLECLSSVGGVSAEDIDSLRLGGSPDAPLLGPAPASPRPGWSE